MLEVVAHLSSLVALTRRELLARLARYGSGTDAANQRAVRAWAAKGSDELARSFGYPKHLGLGLFYPRWALCEAVVHQQGIRRPLGRAREIPTERLTIALGMILRLPIGTGAARKGRTYTWRATDIDWSHGKGPEISGPAEAILMTLAGRAGLGPANPTLDLAGPGLELLAS